MFVYSYFQTTFHHEDDLQQPTCNTFFVSTIFENYENCLCFLKYKFVCVFGTKMCIFKFFYSKKCKLIMAWAIDDLLIAIET